MKLFVYGSLKRGFSNHHFLAGQLFLGEARTIAPCRMYDCGGYPAAQRAADGYPILGELWEIDAACAKRIDWLEGVECGLYERATVEVDAAELLHEATIYLYSRSIEGLEETGPEWKKAADILPPETGPEDPG